MKDIAVVGKEKSNQSMKSEMVDMAISGPEVVDMAAVSPEIVDTAVACPEVMDMAIARPEVMDTAAVSPDIEDTAEAGPELVDMAVVDLTRRVDMPPVQEERASICWTLIYLSLKFRILRVCLISNFRT